MKKSDSEYFLEEKILVKNKSQNQNNTKITTTKTSATAVDNKKQKQRILRKSFSENISSIEKDNEKLLVTSTPELLTTTTTTTEVTASSSSPTTTGKIKSRSRLSAAFRSLRRTKNRISNKKSGVSSTQLKRDSIKAIDSVSNVTEVINPLKLQQQISNENDIQKIQTELTTPIVKKKKSKLSKRFSLGGIKKHKLSSRVKNNNQFEIPIFISSSTQTPDYLERRILENSNNLNNSQLNLFKTNNSASVENERQTNQLVNTNKLQKIQNTLSGKGIEKIRQQSKNLSITTTSITENEDYLTALPPEISTLENVTNLDDKNPEEITNTSAVDERRDERGKLNVTQSSKDTPPQERAPKKPNLNPISVDHSIDHHRDTSPTHAEQITTVITSTTTTTTTTSPTASDANSGKGAIRKSVIHQQAHAKLKRQQSREEYFDSERLMRREGNLDRGRRIPRRSFAAEQSSLPELQQQQSTSQQQQQQQQQQQHQERQSSPSSELLQTTNQIKQVKINKKVDNIQSGNNITNPNLSGSIANTINQSLNESEDQQNPSVELTVRESKIQFSVGKAVSPYTSILSNQIKSDSKDYSSIDSNKSSDSQSPVSESSIARRKIKYIDQATFYTDEEREILSGKREIYSQLSGISEYSIDSELSIDTQMPAFGDLTMDHEEAPIMTTLSEKREHLYKILVIGELGTGKTSFIKRYVHQFFSQNYRATIGVDFALKVLHWDKNTIVRLQLWDIAGQERFGNMTRVYYKEAVGAFIVFDVTRSGTFDCVSKWKEDLDSKVQLPDGSPIPCILLANKCDQEKQCAITPEKMEEYCRENGFAGWFETSAKDNINIEEAARALVNKILLNDKLISASDIADNDKFALGGGSGTSQSQTKKSCSC